MTKQAIEIKPTTLAGGMPKEEHNGFFGIEDKLLGLPIGRQITAVVTFRIDDNVTKLGKGVQYPVVALEHIEPIWEDEPVSRAREVQEEAYKERTGANQLDFSGVEPDDEVDE